MVLAAQAGNNNTVVQGSTAHSNNCYKQQVAIMLTPVRLLQVANNFCKLT
jgi:hypothetical protein